MTDRRCLRLILVTFGTLLMIVTGGTAAGQQRARFRQPLIRRRRIDTGRLHLKRSLQGQELPAPPASRQQMVPVGARHQFRVDGTVVDGTVTHRHRIVTTVTDLTKVINGVRTVVVFDRDFDDGELQESELAFMAQDGTGRVWNMGEYPEEYTDGQLVGAPSTWISGIVQARAGVGMQAVPKVGTAAYLQGAAPRVDFRDCAQVAQTGERVCVPVRCFDKVLMIDEWAPLDPEGGHQLKYYAPGVGNIKVGALGGDTPEALELVRWKTLDTKDLAAVRKQALAQDRRGYQVSPKVYGRTQPATT